MRAAWLAALALAAWPVPPALAQSAPIPGFVEILPGEGGPPYHLAAAQVVRIGRLEGFTVIDTAAWQQQRSIEPLEVVAQRLAAAGLRLMPLTDLNGNRTYLSVTRIVVVRPSEARHAAGARTAIIVAGLQMGRDLAVRESPAEVKAALHRALSVDAPDPSLEQPATDAAPAPTPPR